EGAARPRDERHARGRPATSGRIGRAETPHRRREPRVRRARARHRPHRGSPARPLRSVVMLAKQIKRLATQSAIYGLGGIVSRLLAVLLLPLYTNYLGTEGFGKIETIVAL